MRAFVFAIVALGAGIAHAESYSPDAPDVEAVAPRLQLGLRSAVGFAPGGSGPGLLFGIETGIVAKRGLGLGLHLFGSTNNPAVPMFSIPKTGAGFGAAGDVRYYIQTIENVSFYPLLSVGFLAGQDRRGTNVVLPLINPGVGVRAVFFDKFYGAFKIGAASFHIPYVAASIGYTFSDS